MFGRFASGGPRGAPSALAQADNGAGTVRITFTLGDPSSPTDVHVVNSGGGSNTLTAPAGVAYQDFPAWSYPLPASSTATATHNLNGITSAVGSVTF